MPLLADNPPMATVRVVVADDDRDTVRTLTALLREEGYDVRPAYSGTDVLREVLDFDADAVLLDIALPELPGYIVARQIREYCGNTRPLLIGISGRYKESGDKAFAEVIGIDHYLVKPYDPAWVMALLAPLKAAA